jgi:hypothetical protein
MDESMLTDFRIDLKNRYRGGTWLFGNLSPVGNINTKPPDLPKLLPSVYIHEEDFIKDSIEKCSPCQSRTRNKFCFIGI